MKETSGAPASLTVAQARRSHSPMMDQVDDRHDRPDYRCDMGHEGKRAL
jgi:hypothetical protein